MFKDAHKVMKAIEHYTLSAQLLPHVPTIFCNLVYTKLFACDWRAYDADFDRLLAMVRLTLNPQPQTTLLAMAPAQTAVWAVSAVCMDLVRIHVYVCCICVHECMYMSVCI